LAVPSQEAVSTEDIFAYPFQQFTVQIPQLSRVIIGSGDNFAAVR
jgi:hypothetical protein